MRREKRGGQWPLQAQPPWWLAGGHRGSVWETGNKANAYSMYCVHEKGGKEHMGVGEEHSEVPAGMGEGIGLEAESFLENRAWVAGRLHRCDWARGARRLEVARPAGLPLASGSQAPS